MTDGQWARSQPLLPPRNPAVGRPVLDPRAILNGITWVPRTGPPWRDTPRRHGTWPTVASRCYRWRKKGVWTRVLRQLQAEADANEQGEAEALGRSQGGFSTKVHVRAEEKGRPVCFVLTAGQRHETRAFEPLLEDGAPPRVGRGRPRKRPLALAVDKGYSYTTVRRWCRRPGVRAVIPTRRDQKSTRHFDRRAYKKRNRVERLFNRLKQYRRVATRYEKCAANYLAMLHLAAILL